MRVQEIRNIKFMATPAQSRDIQEALFARGGYWGKSGPVVQKTHQPFLKLRKGALSLVNTEEGGYEKWRNIDRPEVSAAEALRAICSCEVPRPVAKVIEVPMSEAFEIVAEAYDTTADLIKFVND